MHYAKHPLDRADHIRKNSDELQRLFAHETARFYPISQGKVLVEKQQANAVPLNKPLSLAIEDAVFLGLDNDTGCFAYSHSEAEHSEHLATASADVEFSDLRVAGPMLGRHEGSLLAYAKALITWRESVRFCEHCGSSLKSINGGHVKACADNACGRMQFPRTDPAVIMLVELSATSTSPARCLLGRNHNWPEGVYSTLAGFVEPGESLEHAVSREVYEESRIITDNVRYLASQPWPFPRSIMLGFIATAKSEEITCDPHELEDARWFTKEEIVTFGDWNDSAPGPKLPRKDSIARFLVNHWLDNQ